MTIDDFQKADLRVGLVMGAERVEGSEKLLKLKVDLGETVTVEGSTEAESKPRQILSGIAKWYSPEDILGKKVVVIANLDPRMMMGMESQGMLLAAHGEDGAPVVISPVSDVPVGSKIT